MAIPFPFGDGLVSVGYNFFFCFSGWPRHATESSDRSSSFHARERRLSAGQEVLKDEGILGDAQGAEEKRGEPKKASMFFLGGWMGNCWNEVFFNGERYIEIMWNAEILG